MNLKRALNYAPIACLTFLKIAGFFLLSKLSIETLGHDSFVAFSQIQQIALIALPISTAFLQLAISKSYSNTLVLSESALVRKAVITSLSICALLILIFFAIPADGIVNIMAFSGVREDRVIWLIFSFSIIPIALNGIYYSMLVGRGQTSKLTFNEITVQSVILASAFIALIFSHEIVFIVSSLLSYAILFPYFFYKINHALKDRSAVKGGGIAGISTFIISSVAATISVPLFLFLMRAIISNSEGEGAAAEIIVAHRIVGAMLIPAVIYINNYVQPTFYTSGVANQKNILLRSSLITASYGLFSLVVAIFVLDRLISLFFGDYLNIDLVVFSLLAIAEIIKNASMICAHYFNANGNWRVFVGGEFLFILSAVLLTAVGSGSVFWMSCAYLGAAILSTIYYAIQFKVSNVNR